jgi:hypothetical protein
MTWTSAVKGSHWYMMLAVTLSAAGGVSWVVGRVGQDNGEVTATVGELAHNGGASITPVQDYLRFATTVGERPVQASEPDPQYIAKGLRHLAGALGTLNLGGPDLQVDLRVAAEHLLLNPASTANTGVVRAALISAADALESEQRESEIDLRRLAESIRPDRSLLDQQAAVSQFFRESAKTIQPSLPQH